MQSLGSQLNWVMKVDLNISTVCHFFCREGLSVYKPLVLCRNLMLGALVKQLWRNENKALQVAFSWNPEDARKQNEHVPRLPDADNIRELYFVASMDLLNEVLKALVKDRLKIKRFRCVKEILVARGGDRGYVVYENEASEHEKFGYFTRKFAISDGGRKLTFVDEGKGIAVHRGGYGYEVAKLPSMQA